MSREDKDPTLMQMKRTMMLPQKKQQVMEKIAKNEHMKQQMNASYQDELSCHQ
jgi:hypothetical protein